MPQLRTSEAGRDFIASFEGTKLQSYLDVAGVWTIGTGCTGPTIGPGMQISQAEADRMFTDRLANEFEPAVRRAIGRTLTTQQQFDAFISLAYNIGTGGFARSLVLKHHRDGDQDAAAAAFTNWRFVHGREVRGLLRRRQAEAALYLNGTYDHP